MYLYIEDKRSTRVPVARSLTYRLLHVIYYRISLPLILNGKTTDMQLEI